MVVWVRRGRRLVVRGASEARGEPLLIVLGRHFAALGAVPCRRLEVPPEQQRPLDQPGSWRSLSGSGFGRTFLLNPLGGLTGFGTCRCCATSRSTDCRLNITCPSMHSDASSPELARAMS